MSIPATIPTSSRQRTRCLDDYAAFLLRLSLHDSDGTDGLTDRKACDDACRAPWPWKGPRWWPAVASVGQAVSVGPVPLAMGKLRTVLGELDGARSDLAIAERLARAGAAGVLLRTRLWGGVLCGADSAGPGRPAR